ncbi:MAG: GTPase Era [Nitrospinota bacterium]|nr:GTPase Era [Nitrospinota bacterium]
MEDNSNSSEFRSGFVSIIGRPNVGKSSLSNRVVGTKTSIVTRKPQTTRNRITAIRDVKDGQIIFIDTPGIHRTNTALGKAMVQSALKTYHDADILLFLTDSHSGIEEEDRDIIDKLKGLKHTKVFLVINKIDDVKDRDILLKVISAYNELYPFEDTFPISAMTGENVDNLLEKIRAALPEGPQYFPEGTKTDQPEKFIMAEFIREQVILFTGEELPYVTAVGIDDIQAGKTEGVKIVQATIYVEKDSQKGIIIGKNGSMLKQIGKGARMEMEKRFGGQIYLRLFVKVKKNWTKSYKGLYDFGYSD